MPDGAGALPDNNIGDQAPDGAGELPEEDVEMIDVSGSRESISRAMEGDDHPRIWLPMTFPDGGTGMVCVGRHTTVATVNARLAQVFGQRVYFLGYRVVTGLVISARLTLTMDRLDGMDLDLGVGTFTGDWYGE